jgi:hypothetical protein
MYLPTLGSLVDSARRTAQRFPLVLVASGVAAWVGIALIEDGDNTEYVRLLAAATLGLPLFLALALIAERRGGRAALRWGGAAAGFAVLALFWAQWPGWSDPVQAERYFQLSATFHFLVAFAPYAGFNEPNGFWYYNKALFLRFLMASLYSCVLWGGLAIAFAALDKLLGVPVAAEGYFRLWIVIAFVFNTWFFVGGIPDDLPVLESRRDYPTGLRVFTQYVLLPIVVIYLVILTLYLGKVLITREWPSGWIGYLVSGVAVAGILSWLLVRPLEELTEHAWVKTYTRGFYLAIMPAIVMLWLAIGKRVAAYGITERRYFLVVLSLWLAGIALYYSVRRTRSIAVIPMTLCALGLLTFAGPWGAYAVSRRSQVGRLEALLARDGVLSAGVVHLAKRGISFDDRKEISAILEYLIGTHGVSALPRALRDSIPQAAGRGVPETRAARTRARAIMTALAIAYVIPVERRAGAEGFRYFGALAGRPIPVAGYQYAVHVSSQVLKDSVTIADATFLRLDKRTNTLSLSQRGRVLVAVSLLPAIKSAMERPDRPAGTGAPPLRVEGEEHGAAILAVFTSLYGQMTRDSAIVNGLDGEVFIRLP